MALGLLLLLGDTNDSLILLFKSMTDVDGIFLCDFADIRRLVLMVDLGRFTSGERGLCATRIGLCSLAFLLCSLEIFCILILF